MTTAQRRQTTDAKLRKKRLAEEKAKRERIAAIKGGKTEAKGVVREDWLKSQRPPEGTPEEVTPYFDQLKGWLPDGITPADMPIVAMLARAMYQVDLHGKGAAQFGNEDWPKHAQARDRAITMVERYHRQLQSAIDRRKVGNDETGANGQTGLSGFVRGETAVQ